MGPELYSEFPVHFAVRVTKDCSGHSDYKRLCSLYREYAVHSAARVEGDLLFHVPSLCNGYDAEGIPDHGCRLGDRIRRADLGWFACRNPGAIHLIPG